MVDDILEKHLPLIRRHLPSIDARAITPYYSGHDHYVFVVGGNTAFRFPRSDRHGVNDAIENLFLHELARVSPVPVQTFKPHTDDEPGVQYQVYPFIPGTGLSIDLARAFPAPKLMSVAAAIGQFLTVLHAFPVHEARRMTMPEISPYSYWQWFDEFLATAWPEISRYLSDAERQWVQEKYTSYFELSRSHSFDLMVTHSDMLPEHIIVDPGAHTLSGIIDFAPRIADPANDFKYFDRYGAAFLQEVYRHYRDVEPWFDERRTFYAADLLVSNLNRAIEYGDEECIERERRELSRYIATDVQS